MFESLDCYGGGIDGFVSDNWDVLRHMAVGSYLSQGAGYIQLSDNGVRYTISYSGVDFHTQLGIRRALLDYDPKHDLLIQYMSDVLVYRRQLN